jgi:DNA-binding beta-propeller fold protein YncE
VSDTGNKRIQVFNSNLDHILSFGGPGIIAGRLDEPVGLAIAFNDLLYVADTWNNRVQVFTLKGATIREWPITGWDSQSAVQKPYIATDSAGNAYLSDPQGLRIIVFDHEGAPLTALDLRETGGAFPPLPTGILIDAQNRLWVTDAANHRLLRLTSPNLNQPDAKGQS